MKLSTLAYRFTPYVNSDERAVARLFARLQERDEKNTVGNALTALMQRDMTVLSLWLEHSYKGYNYLTKPTRKRLYENAEKIRNDFEIYIAQHAIQEDAAIAQVSQLSMNTVLARSQPEKLTFLANIMQYLHPGRGLYVYRESSSFGRLLEDPKQTTLEGDCNQIVTLYIYLYAMRYDVSDLQLVIRPGHVALEFEGLGIEATNATFMHFSRDETRLAPVWEIVSVNLLDTSDSYFQAHKVSAENFLPAARMAYLTSSERRLVEGNLKAAYNNTVYEMLKDDRFPQALKYAEQSGQEELTRVVGHNGAVHYMKLNDYSKARRFAAHARDAVSLQNVISHNEGVHYFNAHKYSEAIVAFRRAGDESFIKRCYENLFIREQRALKGVRTAQDVKAHAATVYRMREYAQKSGNTKFIEHANDMVKLL